MEVKTLTMSQHPLLVFFAKTHHSFPIGFSGMCREDPIPEVSLWKESNAESDPLALLRYYWTWGTAGTLHALQASWIPVPNTTDPKASPCLVFIDKVFVRNPVSALPDPMSYSLRFIHTSFKARQLERLLGCLELLRKYFSSMSVWTYLSCLTSIQVPAPVPSRWNCKLLHLMQWCEREGSGQEGLVS